MPTRLYNSFQCMTRDCEYDGLRVQVTTLTHPRHVELSALDAEALHEVQEHLGVCHALIRQVLERVAQRRPAWYGRLG